MTWTPEEQRAHRELWAGALESGRYEQAIGALRDATGFCCLGVACEISGLGKWTDDGGDLVYLEQDKQLPPEVLDWLGLSTYTGFYGIGSLATDNDDGATFAEIAAIIRSEPTGLLT